MCDGRSFKGTHRTVLKRKSQRLSGEEKSLSPQRMGLPQEQKTCFSIGNWKESGLVHLSKQTFHPSLNISPALQRKPWFGLNIWRVYVGCASLCGPGEVNHMPELPGAKASAKVILMLTGCLVGSVSVFEVMEAKQWDPWNGKKSVLSQKHARETTKVSKSNWAS